jgi:hypothetical protein
MDYCNAIFTFGFIYSTLYSIIIAIPVVLLISLKIDTPLLTYPLGILLLINMAFIGPFRAKIATDAYINNKLTFKEAHLVSRSTLITYISFIPGLGYIINLFRKK